VRVTGNVRTRTDHGTVVCLDPRIVTKPYGRMFIESLPECRQVAATLQKNVSGRKPGFADRSEMI